MPRGFKFGAVETAARNFLDKRSFVSLDGHELLRGKDKSERRKQIFARDKAICQVCKMRTSGCDGEWMHLLNEHNKFKRCDCMEGGQWAHHTCHFELDHPGPQFGKH